MFISLRTVHQNLRNSPWAKGDDVQYQDVFDFIKIKISMIS